MKLSSKPVTTTEANSRSIPSTDIFVGQETRGDVLRNMYINMTNALIAEPTNPGKIIYDWIMTDNGTQNDARRQGWLFETICQIVIVLKCLINLDYTEIREGPLETLLPMEDLSHILKSRVEGQGNNKSDITLTQTETTIPFSIKYRNGYCDTDVCKLDHKMKKVCPNNNYKIGLIVKNKTAITEHTFKNKNNDDKILHDKVINDGLLFDETDIIQAMDVFHSRFSSFEMDYESFVEYVNNFYFNSKRKQLVPKLHQQMNLLKFQASLSENKKKMYCIAHKPRSGKSITLLLLCKYLLENVPGYNKILILTSVPSTIQSFIHDLNTYIDFKDILYKKQDEFSTIEPEFRGIVFSSVQYLKTDPSKKEFLVRLNFDAFFPDEAHLGISTDKTKEALSSVEDNDLSLVKYVQAAINKLTVFASGTADKIKMYYKIPNQYVYEWEIEDEAFMKEIIHPDTREERRREAIDFMERRHGSFFRACLNNTILNKDYSKHPTQVLMKYSIPKSLEQAIIDYNLENNTTYGFSCSSLLALKQYQHKTTKKVDYEEEFEICKKESGKRILIAYFKQIISNDENENTVMSQIELTQSSRGSRYSTEEDPHLFLMYLPTHTGNSNIDKLQKTLIKFLDKNNLWTRFHLVYSNSSITSAEDYDNFVKVKLKETKNHGKKGCILLLGNQGTVGVTYKKCDVTISLDDGHNLDNQKQRFSRALTETTDEFNPKTVGINVDMNIQRSYRYLLHMIQRHRNTTGSTQSNSEILYYLYTHDVFLFNPQELNNGHMRQIDIQKYYDNESKEMMKLLDDTAVLEGLLCEDDMRDFIHMDFQQKFRGCVSENIDFEGDQPLCPKGDTKSHLVDGPEVDEKKSEPSDPISPEDEKKIEELINQTYEMCRTFMFPLLSLISRSYKISDFKDIFVNPSTSDLMKSLLENKKIEIKGKNYNIITTIMSDIIDTNQEIVYHIREIYFNADPSEVRVLIEKHFKPTIEEKKSYAEVPTPVVLVDPMLDKIPEDFWKTPKLVFEPCCGKGNFVLGIFNKFWTGLQELFQNHEDRCRVILECIYFADISSINVFITTEILKCEYESRCNLEPNDVLFHSYVGDSLNIDLERTFNITGFDAVIGNPPYNDNSGNKGRGHTLWDRFVMKSLDSWLNTDAYLVYVHPSSWRQRDSEILKRFKEKQLIYLEIHNVKDGQKIFRCSTRYDWYVLQNVNSYTSTVVVDEEGHTNCINLVEWEFIPNMMFDDLKSLTSPVGDRLEVYCYRSSYGADKSWVSKTKTETFKYPVVYTINKDNEMTLRYSKVNDRGHFGFPKFIFSNGAGFYCDSDGDYGLTQWAYCIYDEPKVLNQIELVFRSERFNKIKHAIHLDSSTYNINVMKLFRKDFWREFL